MMIAHFQAPPQKIARVELTLSEQSEFKGSGDFSFIYLI